MSSITSLENFSLGEALEAPVENYQFLIARDEQDFLLDTLEYHHGMKRGRSTHFLTSPLNTINCRRNVSNLLDTERIMLLPSVAIINSVRAHVMDNQNCPLNKRQLAEEAFPNHTYEYSIRPLDFKEAIFVNDPSTGIVTRHDSPYANLPPVQLTLSPCPWAVRTWMLQSPVLYEPIDGTCMAIQMMKSQYGVQIPLEFFYDECALGDFPKRLLPYKPYQLGVPELTTAPSSRKRPRFQLDSESSSSDSEGDWPPPPDISQWQEEARANDMHVIDDHLGVSEYSQEPVRAFLDTMHAEEDWRTVALRKARDTSDSKERIRYNNLAKSKVNVRDRKGSGKEIQTPQSSPRRVRRRIRT